MADTPRSARDMARQRRLVREAVDLLDGSATRTAEEMTRVLARWRPARTSRIHGGTISNWRSGRYTLSLDYALALEEASGRAGLAADLWPREMAAYARDAA